MDESDERQELHPAIRGLKAVCRCNNIKYRTIERAIRRGACTISQIALCTTATTGHCGGSCTPDVQAMLDELGPASGLSAPPRAEPVLANAVVEDAPVPADAWWVRKQ